MKKLLIALAAAGGLCVAAGTAATAAPVNASGGLALGTAQGLFTPVQYYGGYGGGGYGGGYGYRYKKPYCYHVRRCDYYGRCWRERVCE